MLTTPNPLSLLCAILLCFPLALIFTFTAPLFPAPLYPSLDNNSMPPSKPTLIVHQFQNPTNFLPTPNLPHQPPIIQDAKEENDKMLFQRASPVDSHQKPIKKLAFMFLTTIPLPFAPLWDLFFARAPKTRYNIYVHADPTANYSFTGIFTRRLIPSILTRRHTPTLIAAARRLLAHALQHDESNSMFALLSPSCIPLHSFDYTYKTLIRSRRSFIEILKDEPGAYNRWAARGDAAMVPEVEFRAFRIGSQFWVIRRKHARAIVRDRKVWSKFKLPCLRNDSCYPEEQYFPTLLSIVDRRGCIPCTLTHVDWRGSHGGHPKTYVADEVGPELIWSLRKKRPRYGDDPDPDPDPEKKKPSNATATARRMKKRNDPFLFARKFSPDSETVHRLISIADDVIFKD